MARSPKVHVAGEIDFATRPTRWTACGQTPVYRADIAKHSREVTCKTCARTRFYDEMRALEKFS